MTSSDIVIMMWAKEDKKRYSAYWGGGDGRLELEPEQYIDWPILLTDIDPSQIYGISSYVGQDDILVSFWTVKFIGKPPL